MAGSNHGGAPRSPGALYPLPCRSGTIGLPLQRRGEIDPPSLRQLFSSPALSGGAVEQLMERAIGGLLWQPHGGPSGLFQRPLRVPRQDFAPDPRYPSSSHPPLCRRRGPAADPGEKRNGESSTDALVRLEHPVHGGADRRGPGTNPPLLPFHHAQHRSIPFQHRPFYGGNGAKYGMPWSAPFSPYHASAYAARFYGRIPAHLYSRHR